MTQKSPTGRWLIHCSSLPRSPAGTSWDGDPSTLRFLLSVAVLLNAKLQPSLDLCLQKTTNEMLNRQGGPAHARALGQQEAETVRSLRKFNR